ncbi:MAG: aminopeptidase P family protein [Desulfamplus sp.]|nr:aminopeptidase P family protein [Desulfamplus sp.]
MNIFFNKLHIKTRVEKLRKAMEHNGFDTTIIFSDENRRYLSGFTGEDGNYDESAGILIITMESLILATDGRYETQAAAQAPLYNVFCYKENIPKELPSLLASVNARNTALETSRLTVDLYNKIKIGIEEQASDIILSSADTFLKHLRIIKDEHEVGAIRESLKIAEKAFLELKGAIHEGMTEKEAAWFLEKAIRENGADSLSFDVIAASGPNAALPHAVPGERKFRKNEPLLFDFGARLNGYCSDTTRTLIMGVPENTFKAAYETLFNAQKLAIDAIKPGIPCSEIDKIARDYIEESRFKGAFTHSLGHGVGIAIHEAPRLSKFDETPLQAGMVVTVEPGIYIPEWGGIRLENMVWVTTEGAQVLNETGYEDHIVQ